MIGGKELAEIGFAAHRIRGTALLIGARRIAGQLMQIEDCCGKGDADGCQRLIAGISELWTATIAELRREASRLGRLPEADDR